MMHVAVVGTDPQATLNFRSHLIADMVKAGCRVSVLVTPANDDQRAQIKRLGASYVPYYVRRAGLNPLQDVRTWWELRRIFRRLRPDVVMPYTHKPVIWSGMALRGLDGARFYPLITGLGFAFHGDSLHRRALTGLMRALYKTALRRSAGVMFQNPDNLQLFRDMGLLDGLPTTVVNGSGVDITRFAPVPLPDAPVFLMVSRLKREKGIFEYLRAARIVRARYPHAHFILTGPEDPAPDGLKQSHIQEWIDDGSVEYTGPVSDVRTVLERCAIFVLPSYSEGLPRSVIEAMSMARPVITTDVPGCRQTVDDGVNGHLVPSHDVEALAERMMWMIEHPDEWAHMGQASRDKALADFDVHKVNRDMMLFMGLPM